MPVISIKSLPFAYGPDIPSVLDHLAQRLSSQLDIAPEHFSLTWDYLHPGHYSHGGRTADHQPETSHPILVSILLPELFPLSRTRELLNLFAEELAISVRVSQKNIFIQLTTARSGTVYSDGSLVEWAQPERNSAMTDQPQRSGEERRTEDERRTANVPNASPEERRSGVERRSGEDRRKSDS